MEICFASGDMEMLVGARVELVNAQVLNPGDKGADKALRDMETRRKIIMELEEE